MQRGHVYQAHGAWHLRYRVDRKHVPVKLADCNDRVSHSQERPPTSGASSSRRLFSLRMRVRYTPDGLRNHCSLGNGSGQRYGKPTIRPIGTRVPTRASDLPCQIVEKRAVTSDKNVYTSPLWRHIAQLSAESPVI